MHIQQIEILFEKLFKEIKLCPIRLVDEKVKEEQEITRFIIALDIQINKIINEFQRKKAEKDRKQFMRDEQNKRKKEELDKRNEKNRIKMTQATKKK